MVSGKWGVGMTNVPDTIRTTKEDNAMHSVRVVEHQCLGGWHRFHDGSLFQRSRKKEIEREGRKEEK